VYILAIEYNRGQNQEYMFHTTRFMVMVFDLRYSLLYPGVNIQREPGRVNALLRELYKILSELRKEDKGQPQCQDGS
jgi:hypothetical protein